MEAVLEELRSRAHNEPGALRTYNLVDYEGGTSYILGVVPTHNVTFTATSVAQVFLLLRDYILQHTHDTYDILAVEEPEELIEDYGVVGAATYILDRWYGEEHNDTVWLEDAPH